MRPNANSRSSGQKKGRFNCCSEQQPCGVQVMERVGLGSNGVDELLDTLRGCDDLRNRFPVLVDPVVTERLYSHRRR